MAAILDFQQNQTSDSLRNSLVVHVAQPENMGKAVGISLLSWIIAKIYVVPLLLPVDDCNPIFKANLDVGQFAQ